MIPQFPKFKNLELSDRSDVEAFTNLFEPYSDYNFTCLWIWDMHGKRELSELNGNLVIQFTDYMDDTLFLSFIGTQDRENTILKLIDYCKEKKISPVLRLVPDVSIQNVNLPGLIIEEEPGDFDYILSIKDISELAGTQFHRKRKNANRFWRENPSAKIEVADLSQTAVQEQIFKTIEQWESNKQDMKKDYVLEHELSATKKILKSDKLNSMVVLGLFLENKMIGYAIAEILQNGYAILHFMKSDVSYNGSNEALMQGVARHLDSLLVEFLNIESDLNFENMRKAKIAWRPVKFLKRYNIKTA